MNKGVIYILTNPSFPQYVKIGYADDMKKLFINLSPYYKEKNIICGD